MRSCAADTTYRWPQMRTRPTRLFPGRPIMRSTIGTAVEAIRLGAINYLNKPADADEVEAALLGKRPPPPVGEVPSLDRQEWEYLNRILADCNGNISEAARRLKMHRRTLQRKLQKHPPKVLPLA